MRVEISQRVQESYERIPFGSGGRSPREDPLAASVKGGLADLVSGQNQPHSQALRLAHLESPLDAIVAAAGGVREQQQLPVGRVERGHRHGASRA